MKNSIFGLGVVFAFFLFTVSVSFARIATEDDIRLLKNDIRENRIEVGKTRMMEILNTYGKSQSISDSDRRTTYDYGDLRLVFDKKRIWKSWRYDSFKDRVYTDSVDDLRFDLESQELVGKNVTLAQILKDYGSPTEMFETDKDGDESVYYYGDIKLTFENVFVISSWRGQNLDLAGSDAGTGVLTGTGE